MNLEQALCLPYVERFKEERVRAGFKVIKFRAGNKAINFEVQSKFIGLFRKYIEFRNFVLKGKDFEFLFFKFGNSSKYIPKYTGNGYLYTTNKAIKNLCDKFPNITSRELRSFKSHWLINNVDTSVAATVLQNSERTIARHYSLGSVENAKQELSLFYRAISKQASNHKREDSYTQTPIGQCRAFRNPDKIVGTINLDANCETFEGCLNCKNYVIHIDEVDVRKLLSFKYCVKEVRYLFDDITEFDEHYGQIVSAIDVLLEELSSISSESRKLVGEVSKSVFEKEFLDDYWELKLSQYTRLGIA